MTNKKSEIANYYKFNLLATILASSFLFGCGSESEEAKKLGFASAEEMKEVHARGWHTLARYEEDTAKQAGYSSVKDWKIYLAKQAESDKKAKLEKEQQEKEKVEAEKILSGIKERSLNFILVSVENVIHKYTKKDQCYITLGIENPRNDQLDITMIYRALNKNGLHRDHTLRIGDIKTWTPGLKELNFNYVEGLNCDDLTSVSLSFPNNQLAFNAMEQGLKKSSNFKLTSNVPNVRLEFDASEFDSKIPAAAEWMKGKPERDKAKAKADAQIAMLKAETEKRGSVENWTQGSTYKYYGEGENCTEKNNDICLSSEQFKSACLAAKGITRTALTTRVMLSSKEEKTLGEGGSVEGQSIRYGENRAGKYVCSVSVTVSGLVDGSSRRLEISGNASSFIKNSSGQILVNYFNYNY